MKSGIYKIRNIKNNKLYIGSTISLQKRKSQHFSALRGNRHHNIVLQNSFNKNKENDFLFEIIEMCEPEKLIEREQFFIDLYEPFYNLSPTAGNTMGFVFSEQSKKKISEFHKGKKMSKETKERMSRSTSGELNPMFGKKHSAETRKKISSTSTGISRNVGLNNPNNSVTPEIVREIRSKYKKGIYGYIRLANEYGVSRGCIEGIITRRTWRDL